MPERSTNRVYLLAGVSDFVRRAKEVPGVLRVSLVGSLTTPKDDPKDADVLVTVGEDFDIRRLAKIGRGLKGSAQQRNMGADIFIAREDGTYIGRTCSFKDCHPRRRCEGQSCGTGGWLCDDLHNITLSSDLIAEPPADLWPEVVVRADLPQDARAILLGEGDGPSSTGGAA